MSLITIDDFSYPQGWNDLKQKDKRARWCCSQLEDGHILFFDRIPFDLPEADVQFLRSQQQSGSALHKNVSYRPQQDELRGFAAEARKEVERLHQVMHNYSSQVVGFLSQLLAPYSAHWKLDFASFRPLEEEGRDLPLHKRNDLLHVDAFPSRPTRGGRILRCFTNINPSHPRRWLIGDQFAEIAKSYAIDAGLPKIVRRAASPGRVLRRVVAPLQRLVRIPAPDRAAYDEFMLRFHDYLKENADFQREGTKIRTDFPPSSTWIVFTDSVPHAVLSGRLALEQTFIIPVSALVAPEKSPLRKLEEIAGRSLVN
jgi:3-deoxy-D-manno-octulosonic acid hydroxylase-like protein